MAKKKENNDDNITCAFCGKHADEATSMIGTGDVYICEDCICDCFETILDRKNQKNGLNSENNNFDFSSDSFADDEEFQNYLAEQYQKHLSGGSLVLDARGSFGSAGNKHNDMPNVKLKKPSEIYESLSEHVVGQEDAKRHLAISVYNHYKRIFMGDGDDDVEIQKSNILLLGPTGSGKTLLAQTLAKTIQVPFAIADATTLTEAGYVGDDVENILRKLLIAADWNVEAAQVGIVYVDEIDKIARKGESASITRDVSGEGVQQGLLKIIEGCEATVPPQGGRKHPTQEVVDIDTTNILFILGGAFVGLSDIIAKRIGKKGLGFTADNPESVKKKDSELLSECLPEDLQSFGLIPEFVGRIPVITSLNELEVDDLVHILTNPKNALVKQYKKLFSIEDCTLTFKQDALFEIASEAKRRGTGARGLRSIIERVLEDVMFELPEIEGKTKVTIHKSDVVGSTKTKIERMRSHAKKTSD